jgi:hypothetical protein
MATKWKLMKSGIRGDDEEIFELEYQAGDFIKKDFVMVLRLFSSLSTNG